MALRFFFFSDILTGTSTFPQAMTGFCRLPLARNGDRVMHCLSKDCFRPYGFGFRCVLFWFCQASWPMSFCRLSCLHCLSCHQSAGIPAACLCFWVFHMCSRDGPRLLRLVLSHVPGPTFPLCS